MDVSQGFCDIMGGAARRIFKLNTKEKTEFAHRLRALRIKRWLSQSAAAEYIGVTMARYSNWEQGRTMPPLTVLPSIAKAFDVTLNELMGVEPQGIDEVLYRQIAAMPNGTKKRLAEFLNVMAKKERLGSRVRRDRGHELC